MLQRIKSKKGFTLAELLIVVAIIAVLAAIAVPLFASSLKKANEAVFQSNQGAVRSAGIVAVLSDEGNFDFASLKKTDFIKVTGTFSSDGKTMEGVTCTVEKAKGTDETTFEIWSGNKGQIILYLTVTEIKGTITDNRGE